MELTSIASFMLLGLSAGFLIGSVGIGGVIVVPALVYLCAVPIHTAVSAAMLAFLVSGAVGTLAYAGKRSIRWRPTRWLWAGAMPAALLGALTASSAPPGLIEAAIGCLAALASLRMILAAGNPVGAPEREPSGPVLCAAGAATGFLSALTGTGGPLVLVPVLAWPRSPASYRAPTGNGP